MPIEKEKQIKQAELMRENLKLTPKEVAALGLDPAFQWYNYNGWLMPISGERGVSPFFITLLNTELNKKMPANIVVNGRQGIGKSYMATDIARILDPKFTVDQVVFTFNEYFELTKTLPMRRVIVFDEPSYAMSHREWYKELNKVLVKTMESQRFKVHPILIPVINKALLDRTIRRHLIHYQIVVVDRGYAIVYKIEPSQFVDKVFHYKLGELHYALADWHKCNRDSCLGCNKLKKKTKHGRYVCNLFRAQYERKKQSIQEERYEEAAEEAKRMEEKAKKYSNEQIAEMILQIKDEILKHRTSQGYPDPVIVSIKLEEHFGISVSERRIRKVLKYLALKYPEEFGKKKE